MEQSIIDKIELIEKENRLRKRAIKLGICPICGEKTEQYTRYGDLVTTIYYTLYMKKRVE